MQGRGTLGSNSKHVASTPPKSHAHMCTHCCSTLTARSAFRQYVQDVHVPVSSLGTRAMRRAYHACMAYVDHNIGELLDDLEARAPIPTSNADCSLVRTSLYAPAYALREPRFDSLRASRVLQSQLLNTPLARGCLYLPAPRPLTPSPSSSSSRRSPHVTRFCNLCFGRPGRSLHRR